MTRNEKLQDIEDHPENHRHDFAGLHECCTQGGALDLGLVEAHSKHAPIGRNGGVRCDVVSGPCACGAWH